jgi:hypothetical protein
MMHEFHLWLPTAHDVVVFSCGAVVMLLLCFYVGWWAQ